jgi:hypothetical protein
MTRKTYILALGLSILITCFLLSCKSDAVGPLSGTYITGIVKDAAGILVPNAYLNFIFYLRNKRTNEIIGGVPPNPDSTSHTMMVEFDIPRRGLVNVVMRNYLHEYIKTVLHDTLDEGTNAIEFPVKDVNGRTLYSDLYLFESALSDSPLQTQKILLDQSLHLAPNPAVYAQTDNNGRFLIPLMRLPFKEIFPYTVTNDTLIFDNRQTLYAFTTTRYGKVEMSLSAPADITIILNKLK